MNTDNKAIFFLSPLRLTGLMIATIFFTELIIMLFLIPELKELPAGAIALIDALTLTAVFLPVLWWFIIRPLRKATLKEKARAADVQAQAALDWEDTFNTITDIITIHDKDFTIVRANRAAEEKLGLRVGDLGAIKCFQRYHGVDCAPAHCPSCQSLVSAEPVIAEFYEPHLNMYLEARAIPRVNADHQVVGLIHVVRDITQRKRMEALLESRKIFAENLVQNSAVATFVLDPMHKVVLWNKACEELTGISAAEMIGTDNHWKPFYEKKRPTLADIVIDNAYVQLSSLYGTYSQSSLISEGVHAEGWFLNMNGKNRYMVFDAAPIYSSEGELQVVMETLQDIPERKRIEEELARSESKLRALIEAEQDSVMLVSSDGTLLEMNPAGLAMIEAVAFEQVAGKSIYDLVLPEHRRKFKVLSQSVFDGEAAGKLEFECVGLKGTRRWVETRAVPLRNADAVVIAILCVARDITEYKQLEAQLRHAQKMEAVGTLTGGIAHDFNNILMSIIGYSELLGMTMREEHMTRNYLDHILSAAKRATNLTQNLLAFSRKQVMNPRAVDLNGIIRNVEKMLHRLIGEEVELRTNLLDQELFVMADAGQIEQVLMNLALNARDAMKDCGVLHLATSIVEIESDYISAKGYGTAGRFVFLTITDTGAGMDQGTRERIFEPFFTTKEVGKGTGLGLSIVYGIVKQHNGYIDCDSEPGKGTTFTLRLPLVTCAADEEKKQAFHALKGGKETVLVTEDDAAVRSLTKTMLELLGYSVIEAVNGEEAVIKFKEHQHVIDLLILDVIMPKKNGKQAYDEIRAIRPDIKALFTSGYTGDVISDKGVLEDGMHFLPKPSSLKDLSEKIREVLAAG